MTSDEARLQEIRKRLGDHRYPVAVGDVYWLLSLVERLQQERDEAYAHGHRMESQRDAAEAALTEARAKQKIVTPGRFDPA